jgi:2,3-bisphosphoglycerate-independent phosphoglycerate mutase
MLLPDHATPISLKTHCHDDVPFVIFDSGDRIPGPISSFDEKIVWQKKSRLRFKEGFKLINSFLGS